MVMPGFSKSLVGVDLRCLPPPVTIERRLTRMTRLAQATQVRKVVATTVLERQDVVDFSHRRYLSLSLAVFTQRVLGNVCGTNPAPACTITLVDSRVALKLTVVLVRFLGVYLAEPFAG